MVQAERRRGRRRSHEHKVFTGRPELESRTGAIDANGAYTGQTLYIAAALKDGVLHKAMWLHVLSSDSQLLLHRARSGTSDVHGPTCIVRNQHVLRETDEHCNMSKVPPLAVPQLSPCASSAPAWRLCAARHSQIETQPLSAQPLPRVLELAASKVAHSTCL